MAFEGQALYWLYTSVAAAGTLYSVDQERNANLARQRVLEQELRSNELAALDEENRRLQALRYANDEMLTMNSGIDAWSSPSFIAARNFNFKMGMEDIENTRFNLMGARAGISARIGILKNNSRAALGAGLFEVAGIFTNAAWNSKQLAKSSLTKSLPKAGEGGLNSTMGVGILDTPGGTGALS